MTKAEEISDAESTWNRTADDEPVFILVGRDEKAWRSVLNWAQEAEESDVNAEKVAEARQHAQRMQAWPGKKKPD